jgi:hypothetical protein
MKINFAKQPIVLVIPVALLALSGCLFSPPEKPPVENQPVEYNDYTTPDNLVANFVLAWVNRDIVEYRDKILFNDQKATDGGTEYAPFTFYYIDGEDPFGNELPDLQRYEDEVTNTGNLFSGNDGKQGTPGVRSIDLSLTKNQTWTAPTNPIHVENDPYPQGTLRAYFSTDMLVSLKSNMPGSDTNGFLVQENLEFHVIPIIVGEGTDDEHTEYRLWKWHDLP